MDHGVVAICLHQIRRSPVVEHNRDADFDPAVPAASDDIVEPTPRVEEDVTWASVLTGEELDAPAGGASGNTEELVGVTDSAAAEGDTALEPTGDEDDFMGFEENISVADTDFSRPTLASQRGTAMGEAVATDEVTTNTPPVDNFEEEDATQVLRRSLIQGDAATETVVEAASAVTLAGG